jgi:hypothetical protein
LPAGKAGGAACAGELAAQVEGEREVRVAFFRSYVYASGRVAHLEEAGTDVVSVGMLLGLATVLVK